MCETERHICFSLFYIQICQAISLHKIEWEPPILRRYSTAVVLSVRYLIWQFEEVLHNYCKPRNGALSSKYLICCFSTLDHLSPAILCCVVAPIPAKNICVHDKLDTTMIYSIFRKLCIGYPPLDVRFSSVWQCHVSIKIAFYALSAVDLSISTWRQNNFPNFTAGEAGYHMPY